MRSSRFTEVQIIGILEEAEGAANVGDVARRHGISRDTLYRWRRKCNDPVKTCSGVNFLSSMRRNPPMS